MSRIPHLLFIFQIFPHSEKIENINDQYWTLRAEEASSSPSLPCLFIIIFWISFFFSVKHF